MCYIDVLQSGTRSQEAPTDQHGNVGQGTCEISHWNSFTESLLPYFGDQLSLDTCTCHHFFTSSNPPNLRGDSHCWLRAEWSFWIMFYECMNPWEPHMWTKWKNFDVVRFVWTCFAAIAVGKNSTAKSAALQEPHRKGHLRMIMVDITVWERSIDM